MRIPAKPGTVRRNSSSTSPSFRGNQDLLGQALGVASPPSSTSPRKTVKKKKTLLIPTVPSLTSNKQQQAPPAASEAMSVSKLGRRKLGKDGLSDWQKKQQEKRNNDIIHNMKEKLRESYRDKDSVKIEQVRKYLKKRIYGHLSSIDFRQHWSDALTALEQEAEYQGYEDEEQKKDGSKRKRASSDITIRRKRPSISSAGDMSIPRKRHFISLEDDMSIARKRSSISSEGDANVPRKRSSIGSEGSSTHARKPTKRPSPVLEEPEVVCLIDTDDEQEWSGDDNAESEKVAKKDKHRIKKKKSIEVPKPIVQVDPFAGAGPNRWANLIVGSSKFQGESFSCGDWDSIQPVVT